MSEAITWTRPKLQRFKLAFSKAKVQGHETFLFEGHEFVVGYAHYLIEYLDLCLEQE